MSSGVDLLQTWLKRVRESSFSHYAAEERYSKLHYYLGVPAALFAAIVGTSVFTSLDSDVEVRIKILIGFISVATAVLASLQTFMRFSERAELHRKTAIGYASIRRAIEQELVFPNGIDATKVEIIRKRIDEIGDNAPNIPGRIWKVGLNRADKRYFLSRDE